MAAGSIAAFWAIACLLVIVPGPDWAFTISAGLRGRSVLPAVGGIVLGYAALRPASGPWWPGLRRFSPHSPSPAACT
jgi:threonine/homoserine/homoserine lactone efflux protein